MITTALDGMGRWVYGLDHNGDRGKVKRLKKTNSLALTGLVAGDCADTCVFSAFGYGAEGLWWAKPHTLTLPFSPTHPYGRKEQRPHKETKNRQVKQAGWLKS